LRTGGGMVDKQYRPLRVVDLKPGFLELTYRQWAGAVLYEHEVDLSDDDVSGLRRCIRFCGKYLFS